MIMDYILPSFKLNVNYLQKFILKSQNQLIKTKYHPLPVLYMYKPL